MIVRESHTSTRKNKQGLLERLTGCKHRSFNGKIRRAQREKERERRGTESKWHGQSKTSTERRKKALGEAGLFV